MPEPITPTEYRAFQKAYDFFNAELFSGALPHVLVTLQRRARSSGYFAPERFAGRARSNLNTTAHELALNPDNFKGHADRDILATLTHEMVHAWQQTHGKPDYSYHDRQWAAKMKEIGLHPSATGEPGGKETGKLCRITSSPEDHTPRPTKNSRRAASSWAGSRARSKNSRRRNGPRRRNARGADKMHGRNQTPS